MAKDNKQKQSKTEENAPDAPEKKDLGLAAEKHGIFKSAAQYAAWRVDLIEKIEKVLASNPMGPMSLAGSGNIAVDAIATKIIRGQQMGAYATYKLLRYLSSLGNEKDNPAGGRVEEIPALHKPTGDVVVVDRDTFRECIRVEAKGLKGTLSAARTTGVIAPVKWTDLVAPQGESDRTAWVARFESEAKAAAKKSN